MFDIVRITEPLASNWGGLIQIWRERERMHPYALPGPNRQLDRQTRQGGSSTLVSNYYRQLGKQTRQGGNPTLVSK